MNKNVDDLRTVLFNMIEGVRIGDISLEKARTVADLSQVIVNSAKMEVEFIKATNGKGRASGFLGTQEVESTIPPGTLPVGFVGSTTHRIGDTEPGENIG
jgi:hypothetical protein